MVIPELGSLRGVAAARVSQLPLHVRLLELARSYDRRGQLDDAGAGYEAAVSAAEAQGDADVLVEALRRLAVIRHRCQQPAAARALGRRSHQLAAEAGKSALMAEALNTLGGFCLLEESYDQAQDFFHRALAATDAYSELRGRIEQNLGTVESIRGDHSAAIERYQRSLDAFLAASNESGCAIAYLNLGVISTERRSWADADRYFRLSLKTAEHIGDIHLSGLALLNRSEVLVALGKLREARLAAEAAAAIFDELHAPAELADAYRILGVVCREAGELNVAQARLRLAVEIAVTSGSALSEVETVRELAVARALAGHLDDALELLSRAAQGLSRLKAGFTPDEILRGEYPAFARAWGDLLRVVNRPAFEHSGRVAARAAAVSRALGHDDGRQARVAVGAYLHEIGRLRLPETLRSARPHTLEDAVLVGRYPVFGADLLCGVEVHQDVLAMIRFHQERWDGSGYPDGLRGEAVSVEAQIIGIVDHYDDCLTADRKGCAGAPIAPVIPGRWQPSIVDAFIATCPHGSLS